MSMLGFHFVGLVPQRPILQARRVPLSKEERDEAIPPEVMTAADWDAPQGYAPGSGLTVGTLYSLGHLDTVQGSDDLETLLLVNSEFVG